MFNLIPTKVEFYCDYCELTGPVEIEPLSPDDLNDANWGDIVCVRCRLVIATITADEPGTYLFAKLAPLPLREAGHSSLSRTRGWMGLSLLGTSLVVTIATRLHHVLVNSHITEAQALMLYLPIWLGVIILASIGFLELRLINKS